MTVQQPLDRADAARRYTEWQRIIAIGAYSESPPEDYDEEWEPDGSLWYGAVNIDEALATLEARADAEDLKFVSTTPYKANTPMTYVLVALTDEEKQERDARRDALRQAAIAAQFRWQDQSKIVLDQSGYVMGKLPGETPAYVVQIDAEIRENDPLMSYSWPARQTLTVTWKEDGTPVIDDATDEQIASACSAQE